MLTAYFCTANVFSYVIFVIQRHHITNASTVALVARDPVCDHTPEYTNSSSLEKIWIPYKHPSFNDPIVLYNCCAQVQCTPEALFCYFYRSILTLSVLLYLYNRHKVVVLK